MIKQELLDTLHLIDVEVSRLESLKKIDLRDARRMYDLADEIYQKLTFLFDFVDWQDVRAKERRIEKENYQSGEGY